MCIIFSIFLYLFLNMKKRCEKNKNKNKNNKKQDIENSEIIEQKECCKGLTINDTIIEIRDIDYLDKMNSQNGYTSSQPEFNSCPKKDYTYSDSSEDYLQEYIDVTF